MRMPRGLDCKIGRLCATVGLAALMGLATPHAHAAGGLSISNPDGAAVRALVIGVDDYQHVRKLKGAVADATDIVSSLKSMGVGDVVELTNAQADRASVLREISALVERTKSNDIIFLSIAGHGTQEPERVKGSEPDGMENVFLLPGFETTPAGSVERILGGEFNHFIRQFELRGAKVIFVADTCHGGGMVRDIDPRAAEMSFRQVPRYTLLVDELKPVSDSNDPKSELDLDHTAFLAAVDRYTKAPEVRIPGIDGLRGALSYAVARAVEGSADINHDGKVTLKELFSNVRQVVYQLSDQRQSVVTISSPAQTPETDVAFELTRGVVLIQGPAARAGAAAPVEGQAPGSSAATAKAPTVPRLAAAPNAGPIGEAPGSAAPTSASPSLLRLASPIRLAALDGKTNYFAGVTAKDVTIKAVQPTDNPDLIWDPVSHDVIAWGDVVAYGVDVAGLPTVVDRTAAIRELKRMATRSPQMMRIWPDDRQQRAGQTVEVDLSDVASRAVLLFNVSGDGTIQMLYPVGSDAALALSASLRLPLRVGEPFGAEQIVAVTSQQRMVDLEKVLMQLNRRRASGQVIKGLERYLPADARIASIGFFSAP
ncbi:MULTISPECIES: caspase family protein [unclassified Bradyrhizobium]|uniref:caspase family protein n=1 Tax=unclassified Bradyrhizobium TaxID=2631580 RepID=UPI001FFA22AC|nr:MULTISPECIES: caspase family protein [unclassified Bradyrhizobium]MCK1713510.1 caspase family protein [Bradyrhizobium sp. 143]MCK1727537.1 caspase family protein [Bradyrhizobium sp. 142]